MYRVLIVDDDPDVLGGLEKIVDWQGLGLEIVFAASGGQEALSYIMAHPVDILLTDIKMPGMSGIDLIGRIRELEKDVKCIVLSGHDDYRYMQQAIRLGIENYLLKSVNEDELAGTLENIVTKLGHARREGIIGSDPILYENVLYRWLNGRIADRELRERAQLLNIDLSCGSFQACVLRLDCQDLAGAEAALGDLSAMEEPRPLVLRTYEDDYALLFPGTDGAPRPGERMAQMTRLASQVGARLNCLWFFALGQRVKSYQKVHYSYRQAQAALGYSTLLNWPCGLDYDDCAMEAVKEDALGAEHLDKFKSLLLYEPGEALAFIDKLYGEPYDVVRCAPEYLKNTTLRLALRAVKAAERSGPDLGAILGEIPLLEDKIERMKTRAALHEWIRALAMRFMQPQPGAGEALSPMVRRVVSYARRHYMESISLKYLAQELNMNAAYLGRVFKDEMNETLSSYLNRLRIEKAKELLRSTNKSVGEIAKRVGYPSANYFISTFRKYEGALPGEYRKSL